MTNAVVRLHRSHYGKGPTRSKSYLLDDVLVCVMRDVLTTVERTLVEAGEHSKVRATRLAFEDAMRDRFVEAVEGILGRRVLGFTSQVLVEQDVAIEMFVLEAASQ
ncbi:MAG: Na-translocating system protein MpsC family protein [Thermoleophilaceae bacterium]